MLLKTIILLATLPLGNFSYAGEPRYENRALSDLFDFGKATVKIGAVIPIEVGSQIMPSVAEHAFPATLNIDELCQGKEVCILDSFMPLVNKGLSAEEQKKIVEFDRELDKQFEETGRPLNQDERGKVEAALAHLNDTAFGRKLCTDVCGGVCSLKRLEERKISLKMDLDASDTYARTIMKDGKVLVSLNSLAKFANRNSLFVAFALSHELSHAEDYKKHGGVIDKWEIDGEYKAILTQLPVYNELKAKFPQYIDDREMNTLIEVWNWKENGGRYPRDYVYSTPAGLAGGFMKMCIGPSRNGAEAVMSATRNCFYADKTSPTPIGDTTLTGEYYNYSKAIIQQGKSYSDWRVRNPHLANPGIPTVLPPPSQGNSGGGNSSQDGNYDYDDVIGSPFPVNPHF